MGIQWTSQWTVDLGTPVLVHLLLWDGELAGLEEVGELGTFVGWITAQIVDAVVIEVFQSIISESLTGSEDSESKFGLLNWITSLGGGLDIAICVVVKCLAVDTILLAGTEDKELVGDPGILSLHEIGMIVVLWLSARLDWQHCSILVHNIIELLSIDVSSQSTKSAWSVELWDIWDLDTERVVGGEGHNDSLLVLNGESGSRVTDTDGPGLEVGVVPWSEHLNPIDQGGFGATVDVNGQVVKVDFDFGDLGDVVSLSWQLVLSSNREPSVWCWKVGAWLREDIWASSLVIESKTVIGDVMWISTHAGLLDLHVTISSIFTGGVSWFTDTVELMVSHVAIGILSTGVGFAGDDVLTESSRCVVWADTIKVLPWEGLIWNTLSTVTKSWLTANVTLWRHCSNCFTGANLIQEITDGAFVSNRL